MKVENASRKLFQIAIYFSLLFFIFHAENLSAQEYKQVIPGVERANITRKIKDEPMVINLLRLDLTKVRLDVVHALDAAIGLETTSSIATRRGASAAINAGFFRLDKSIFAGDAAGVLQIDGKLLSESNNKRMALLIDNAPIPCSVCDTPENRTRVSFDRLSTWSIVILNKRNFDVLGINREREKDDLVLFTPEFHRTTLTDASGLEIIVRKGKIASIADGQGSREIPPDGFVLSASGKKRDEILPHLKIGRKIFAPTNNSAEEITESGEYKFKYHTRAEDIVGGVPQLIRNGKIEITWEQEKAGQSFAEMRHPRTAVAKLADDKFLMVTVDGRQPGTSVGMNLQELAEMLLKFGAVDAMNLDGGGSTTMFVGGKVINQPSDKEGERKVSDAILVFPRRPQTQMLTKKK
ncbi:MAG: phosphodiester glycosidase family protein [Acidobacteriota bacterium]|nr:phosphodiester glycosidase family protein [Acidobacteriota bacterium]